MSHTASISISFYRETIHIHIVPKLSSPPNRLDLDPSIDVHIRYFIVPTLYTVSYLSIDLLCCPCVCCPWLPVHSMWMRSTRLVCRTSCTTLSLIRRTSCSKSSKPSAPQAPREHALSSGTCAGQTHTRILFLFLLPHLLGFAMWDFTFKYHFSLCLYECPWSNFQFHFCFLHNQNLKFHH